jgi:hypothetical protein
LGKVLEFRPKEREAVQGVRNVPLRLAVNGEMPLYEALAAAGEGIRNPKEMALATQKQLELFNAEAGGLLASMIEFHAKRFHEGYYANVDTSGREQDRMIGILSIAIYLTEVMKKMGPRALEKGDSGTAALFDETLEQVQAFLSNGYYTKRPQEVAVKFETLRPALGSCLNRCGMAGEPTDMQGIIGTYVHVLVERSIESFNRMEQACGASI